MRNKLIAPAALAAFGFMVACGGGQQTETPRARAAGSHPAPAAAAADSGAYTVAAVTGGGTINGTVKFEGTPPPAEKIEVTKDNSVCGDEKTLETVQVDPSGGLSSVVVWIDGISQGKDWGGLDDGLIDQQGCHYDPYIQLVRAGGQLDILNSDPVLHNIHAYYHDSETLFNLAQPSQGMRTPKTLEKVGPVHMRCDVHSWMSAWVFVASSPYVAVSSKEGGFTIGDVPPGTYKVKAWHSKFGEKTADVTVEADGTAVADFTMP